MRRHLKLGAPLCTVAMLALCFLSPQPTQADPRTWTVQSGEALSILAERFHVTVDQLREWNNLDGDGIQAGQELVVGPDEESSDSEDEESESEAPSDGQTYVVQSGDTLSQIAVRFETTVDELCSWNDELDPDSIREGQRLNIGPARHRVVYRIRNGDSLARIARRHEITVSQLRSWNPLLRGNQIRSGRQLVIYTAVPESTSQAIGYPYQGRLDQGIRLRRHPGFVLRDRNRAWATHETAGWLISAFDAVRARHPQASRIRVHDISNRRGGYMAGHRSHQNGRDVDISYYQRRCNRAEGCPMRRLQPQDVDAAAQWTLFHSWLRQNRAEAIFMDYSLQRPLYEEARRRGATQEQLHRWFQYPRGQGFPLGIIRHYRQHRDHAHVRFRCHDTDEECR